MQRKSKNGGYKMKGHTLPGINQRSEGNTDLPDGRSASSAFQDKKSKTSSTISPDLMYKIGETSGRDVGYGTMDYSKIGKSIQDEIDAVRDRSKDTGTTPKPPSGSGSKPSKGNGKGKSKTEGADDIPKVNWRKTPQQIDKEWDDAMAKQQKLHEEYTAKNFPLSAEKYTDDPATGGRRELTGKERRQRYVERQEQLKKSGWDPTIAGQKEREEGAKRYAEITKKREGWGIFTSEGRAKLKEKRELKKKKKTEVPAWKQRQEQRRQQNLELYGEE